MILVFVLWFERKSGRELEGREVEGKGVKCGVKPNKINTTKIMHTYLSQKKKKKKKKKKREREKQKFNQFINYTYTTKLHVISTLPQSSG